MDIEEDINILENLKKYLNLLIYEGTHKIIYNDLDWDEKTIDCINAIEHILAEREEDKKKIEELEDENRIQRHQIMAAYDNGYIPKQKVKDKIEKEIKYHEKNILDIENITMLKGKTAKEEAEIEFNKYAIVVLKKMLQELIEGRK